MKDKRHNLLRIDDILIKIGLLFLGAFIYVLVIDTNGIDQTRLLIALLFGLPALAFLVAGYRARRRERRALSIWKKLDLASDVAVSDLLGATGYTRPQLEDALLLINQRGEGFYVWDRDSDRIVDGRLRSATVVVEACPGCGSGINKAFPVSAGPPVCPWCGKALAAERWNELKEQAFARIENSRQQPAGLPPAALTPFRLSTFILLIIVFWPAAIAYAMRRNALSGLYKG